MESSIARKPEKRMYEESSEDQDDELSHLKKQKLPGLTSVIMKALQVDNMQRLCSSLEPLLRRIDKVWRLDRIAKDGALHKKLLSAKVVTVEDFLRVLVRDPQGLRSILGSSMSNKMWENTVDHAKTCNLGGKLYVYYANGANGMSAVFNDIYELRGLIEDGHFYHLESLSHDQKILMDSLMKRAYENWDHIIEYDSKILNSLSIQKNEIRILTTVISEQNQQYITEPNPHCQIKHDPLPDSQLIEFPLFSCHIKSVWHPLFSCKSL